MDGVIQSEWKCSNLHSTDNHCTERTTSGSLISNNSEDAGFPGLVANATIVIILLLPLNLSWCEHTGQVYRGLTLANSMHFEYLGHPVCMQTEPTDPQGQWCCGGGAALIKSCDGQGDLSPDPTHLQPPAVQYTEPARGVSSVTDCWSLIAPQNATEGLYTNVWDLFTFLGLSPNCSLILFNQNSLGVVCNVFLCFV